jgi:hypothetical protein
LVMVTAQRAVWAALRCAFVQFTVIALLPPRIDYTESHSASSTGAGYSASSFTTELIRVQPTNFSRRYLSLPWRPRKASISIRRSFLTTIGEGRRIVSVPKKQKIHAQVAACDAVFWIQKGSVRHTVVSEKGKEATIGILNRGDLFGEGGRAGAAFTHGVCNRDN